MKQIFAANLSAIRKFDVKKLQSSKHFKLINNLLDIKSRGDNATLFRVSDINRDLKKVVGIKNLQEIFNNVKFKIPLKTSTNGNTKWIRTLRNVHDKYGFYLWAKQFDYFLTPRMLNNIENNETKWVETYKKEIIQDNENFLKQWKLSAKKVEEIYAETNIWPLFIGTYFLKFRKDDAYLYAPLVLKAVKITFSENDAFIENMDENIIINEKIKYLIEQHSDFKLPILVDGEDVTLSEALISLDKIDKRFMPRSDGHKICFEPFEELNKSDFQNTATIELMPGTCLITCNSGGTKLREAVINLIANDKIDKLIRIDDLKDYAKEAYEKALEKNNIARVTASDFSQEKAIIGTISNSAIIIGPPGTGKSQTIANILVNIAKENKKALFISQKKVALDVVLKRLGKYQNMLFQFSETAKVTQGEKEYFYKPIIEYFKQINEIQAPSNLKNYNSSFFTKPEINYLKTKTELGEFFVKDLDAYNDLKSKANPSKSAEILLKFYKLYNKFSSKNEFLTFFNNYKKWPRKKIAIKTGYLKTKDTIWKLLSPKFLCKWHLTKKITKLYKKYLSKFDIEDLVQMSNFIRLNAFIEFDKKEKEYEKFLSTRKLSNTTPELLEAIYNNCAFYAKQRLDKYRQKGEYERQKLNQFFGRLERKINPPYIITSLFEDIIKEVYNIFVGTPEVLGNFVNFDKDKYDYVIFDEASQIYIEKAIPFISVASKVIVAGDNQQMQPSNWFSTRDESDDEYSEEEITSLLDWAIHNHLPKYVLEMNYRSNSSELVLFSSKEFYDSNLKGLDSFNVKEKTSIDVINVKGIWEDNRNKIECTKMISVCEKYLNKYESIILLAFNRKQQDYIREQIVLTSPKIFAALEDKVILRNIENIQGDEADLVIASVGYTSKTSLHATYIGSKKGRNALNVAITRAKDKMIVIKSISANEIDPKNDNLMTFKKWLAYIELNSDKKKKYASIVQDESTNTMLEKSHFVFELTNWLKDQQFAKNIDLELNYCIGSYTVDIALFDNKKKTFLLGLTIDDSTNADNVDNFISERIKNDFMSVKGYPIYRISKFRFSDEKQALAKFITALLTK